VPPGAEWLPGGQSRCCGRRSLLRLLLLLLTDADLEVRLLRLLIRFVIVASDGIRQIRVNIHTLRQHCHQRETLVAGRAEGTETLDIGNCHDSQCIKASVRIATASLHPS
jgi:hypothetical protein